MNNDFVKILEVIHLGEKLKQELRHSWLSNGRLESVAEHTWRVAFMAVLLESVLKDIVDFPKLLKMIIIHDIAEVEAGDIPAFETINNVEEKKRKDERELQAILKIKDKLGGVIGEDLFSLWLEFEKRESMEAKVANALDKLEAQIQHNEADLSTWLDIEYDMSFQLQKHVQSTKILQELKDLIEQEAIHKIENAGLNVNAYKK